MPWQQPKINFNEYANLKCRTADCGSEHFKTVMEVKLVPGIMLPTGQDQYFFFNILVCDRCGEPLTRDDGKKIVLG